MMNVERPLVIAEPVAEREWQVVAGAFDRVGGSRVLGFIEELGGVYEAEVIDRPDHSQFFNTFKDAVDCFSDLGAELRVPEARRAGAA